MAHSVQSVPRGDSALYLPMLHSLQSDSEVPEAPTMNFPATQLVQSANAVEPVAEYVPAAQDIQLVELDFPSSSLYVPPTQRLQSDIELRAVSSLYFPSPQGLQAVVRAF